MPFSVTCSVSCHITFAFVSASAIAACWPDPPYIGSGRLSVARDLLLSLPSHVTSHAVSFDVEGIELVHFRRFFEVWDGFADLGEVRTCEPQDPAQKFEALEWKKHYVVRFSFVCSCLRLSY